jgi:ATP phosphoribosyltransferase
MTIVFAIPSKGRLKDSSELLLAQAGLKLARAGAERGYRGHLEAIDDVEVAFISATEIAKSLRDGIVDCGITGEDVLREAVPAEVETIAIPLRLPFGNANVVVAVPESWLDVAGVADLDDVSVGFYERHGRRMRVATKYKYLTRRFFAERGVTGYRIVESAGATEGAPAAGSAEIIVDITTTGSTLAANYLKILDDGIILKSQAVLAARTDVLKTSALIMLQSRLAAVAAAR